MNRNYTYNSANNESQTERSGPIEDRLRVQFANRGLGARSVAQAQSSASARTPAGRQSMPYPAAQRRMPVQQRNSNAMRQQSSRAPYPAARKTRAITESRPPVSQKIPLYEKRVRHKSFPMAALVSLLVCTLTVISVVLGSSMVARASRELNDLKHEAAQLQNTERELSQALDRKNDLRTIERIAVDELGMIGTDLITKKYISFSGIDVIEAYDDEEESSVGLSTLLSAIGIGVK